LQQRQDKRDQDDRATNNRVGSTTVDRRHSRESTATMPIRCCCHTAIAFTDLATETQRHRDFLTTGAQGHRNRSARTDTNALHVGRHRRPTRASQNTSGTQACDAWRCLRSWRVSRRAAAKGGVQRVQLSVLSVSVVL
jgi:hypothetical protein